MDDHDIYRPSFVRRLFDEMSRTYGVVNLISSFGFCSFWRRQCVRQVPVRPGMSVYDLMSGTGECWRSINSRAKHAVSIVALDFSPEMCRRATQQLRHYPGLRVEVAEADVLDNTLAACAADCVISTFGLKTFDEEQLRRLAAEVARLLKPGGVFSLLEISVPPNRLLRAPYMFYLRRVVPLLGRLFLGNPENYRMLGIYTDRFRDCAGLGAMLREAGLRVEYRSYFFGCASGLVGGKELG